MLRTTMTMLVRAGHEQRFERAWARSARQISSVPGQRGQALFRDVDQRGRYTVTADWASAEALQAFQSSALRVSLSAALEPLRESASKSVAQVILIFDAEGMDHS